LIFLGFARCHLFSRLRILRDL